MNIISTFPVYLCVISSSLYLSLALPLPDDATDDEPQEAKVSSIYDATGYLLQYGYIQQPDRTGALRGEEALVNAIKQFQRMAGIGQTGELDSETVKWMNYPRCGVVDFVGTADIARKKRYALQGSKWRGTNIKYKITKYTPDLTESKTDSEIERSFKVWEDNTPLRFSKTSQSSKADIDIKFVNGEHGDGEPFDGRGRTLAHAFFPRYGGDTHFDDDEHWSTGGSRGTDLFQVAAHELGHALGLSHSDVQDSMMAPFYRGYNDEAKLHSDDVEAIQLLYGKPSKPRVDEDDEDKEKSPRPGQRTTPRPRLPAGKPDICKSGTLDTITRTEDGNIYAFKGAYYWRLNDETYDEGYPKLISEDWEGLPNNLDASLTSRFFNDNTYFFKGDKYWKFTNQVAHRNYPKKISRGFPGVPNNVDAAFAWSGNGKAYFIKGDKYYRYSVDAVDEGYPKDMAVWTGLPDHIDTAFMYKNAKTYFFSGNNYYKFDDTEFKVHDSYPRLTTVWWFNCKKEDLEEISNYENVTIIPPSGRDVRLDRDDESGNSASSSKSALIVIITMLFYILLQEL